MSSRLHVGTPKIPAKPPRGKPPCTEPAVYGTNILKDPGVELQLATFGGGPGGDEIPQGTIGDGLPYQWSDDSPGPTRSNFITENLSTGFANYWSVSTVNPRTGTYHLRMPMSQFGFGDGQYLYLSQLNLCDATPGAAGRDWVTARVEPGDFVRLGVWAMVSTTVDTPTMLFGATFNDAAGGLLATSYGFDTEPLTTTYTLFEYSGFAPPNARYVVLSGFVQKVDQAASADFDLDDFVLQVSK